MTEFDVLPFEPPSPAMERVMSNLAAVRQEVVDMFRIPAHLLVEPPWERQQAAMRELILKERQATRSKSDADLASSSDV